MTKRKFKVMHLASLALALFFYTTAHSYEVETHEKMSEAAASLSTNLTGYDLATLGLSSQYDGLTYEGLKCRTGSSTKTAVEWIKEGSYCEDETFTQTFARYKNHFYDPVSKSGFGGILWTNSGIISGMPAPDWAIDKGAADNQLYSFNQGRQYFYDGLTKPGDTERKGNLARMFRTLGDVMHVTQDMAQPQHTRNDGHGFPKSFYEVYTKNQALPYAGASIPTFATAKEYLTDLALFSNNNFVSAGTNFRLLGGQPVAGGGYNLPMPGTATDVPVQALIPAVSADILALCDATCVMTFYSTNQTVYNERAAALSIFDQYVNLRPMAYTDPNTLNTYLTDRIFTLNRYTFDSAHPFLIPRAVSYSAGVLDYFFRGKMDVTPDMSSPGFFNIQNTGSEDMNGVFSLYYDDPSNMRSLVSSAVWTLNIPANGQSTPLSFTPPTAAKDIDKYTLVFKGDMGQEVQTAVAAKTANINTGCGVPGAAAGGKLKFTNGGKRTVASVTKTNGTAYDPVAGANEMYSVEGTAPFKVAKRVINGVVSQDPADWLYLSGGAPAQIKLATDNGTAPVIYSGNRGVDKAAFSLTTDTLSFNTMPDLEAPADVDANNTYETCVKAIDGANDTGFETVTAEVKHFYNVTRTYPEQGTWASYCYTVRPELSVTVTGTADTIQQLRDAKALEYAYLYISWWLSVNPGTVLIEGPFLDTDSGLNTYWYYDAKFLNSWGMLYDPTGVGFCYPIYKIADEQWIFTPISDAESGQQFSSTSDGTTISERFTLITRSAIWPLTQVR